MRARTWHGHHRRFWPKLQVGELTLAVGLEGGLLSFELLVEHDERLEFLQLALGLV